MLAGNTVAENALRHDTLQHNIPCSKQQSSAHIEWFHTMRHLRKHPVVRLHTFACFPVTCSDLWCVWRGAMFCVRLWQAG
jgi:hypothetical protein